MCDVCVAERALWATRCGSKKCMAYEEGVNFPMDEAPRVDHGHHPYFRRIKFRGRYSGRARRRMARMAYPAPAVNVRARGKHAENEPASYQIRLDGEPWPKGWTKTRDLAGSVGLYGLDVKWQFMPKIVQEWILGRRRMPDEEEIKKSLGLPKEFSDAPRPIKNAMRLWPRKGARWIGRTSEKRRRRRSRSGTLKTKGAS